MLKKLKDKILQCTECDNYFVLTIGQQYKVYQENEEVTEARVCPACEVRQARIKAWLAAQKQQQGVVKWFDARKGFGFIQSEPSGKIFVHQKNLRGKKAIRKGQQVQFCINETEKGLQATEVTVISSSDKTKSHEQNKADSF